MRSPRVPREYEPGFAEHGSEIVLDHEVSERTADQDRQLSVSPTRRHHHDEFSPHEFARAQIARLPQQFFRGRDRHR